MIINNGPMDLGDIFSNTFTVTGKTLLRNLIAAAVFIIPPGIFMAFAIKNFYTSIYDGALMAAQSGITKPGFLDFPGIMTSLIVLSIATILFLLGYIAAYMGVIMASAGEMKNESLSTGTIIRKIFSVAYWRTLGVILFISLAYLSMIILPIIMVNIGTMLEIPALDIIAGIVLFVSIIFMLFLSVKWYFALVHIIETKETVIGSLKYSSFLVKDKWWNTFGVLILISLIMNFLVTVVSAPFVFLFMWDSLSQYFQVLQGKLTPPDQEAMLNIFLSFGFAMGLAIMLTTFIQVIIAPVFNVVMYYNLQARKAVGQGDTINISSNKGAL